jgi:hypothetical protein
VQLEQLDSSNKADKAIAERFTVVVDVDLDSSISEMNNDELLLALPQPQKFPRRFHMSHECYARQNAEQGSAHLQYRKEVRQRQYRKAAGQMFSKMECARWSCGDEHEQVINAVHCS